MSLRPALLLVAFAAGYAPAAAEPSLAELAATQFEFAAAQYRGMLDQLRDEPARLPRTVVKGQLRTVGPFDWTSGFFPGSLWLIYEHTGDPQYRQAAEDFTRRLESVKGFTGHHDVGFMLDCSYGHAYRLTGDPYFQEVRLQGARSLAKRFQSPPGLIKSWDGGRWKYPVIIDNMMNLEILLDAAEVTGEPRLREIAVSHADRTLANHFRPDGSSYHLLDYDPQTGEVLHRQTVQGHADDSAWARGQAWGLYGFTRVYQLTGDVRYLRQAQAIADFIRSHPRLPADGIPYWDFDAPGIPDAIRDASAGAIMCAALLDLAELSEGEPAAAYRALAERQLRTLSTAAFRAGLGENHHFLLMHSVGHLSASTEIDVPLVYADYYFLEALARVAPDNLRKGQR